MVVVGGVEDVGGQTFRRYWFTVSGAAHDNTPWSGTSCKLDDSGVWSLNAPQPY
jgi:hypothetical protein